LVGRSPLKPRSTGGELQQFDSPCADCPKFTGASKTERMGHLRASHQEYYKRLLKHNNEQWRSAPSSQYVPCELCHKSIRRCNLKDHKLHSHRVDLENRGLEVPLKPANVCDICGHVSKYARDLKKHKKSVHEKIYDHECTYCGKKFSNKGNLNQHESVHTGITQYQCHLCGKQCRRKSELEKHLIQHKNKTTPDDMAAKLEPIQKMETESEVLVTGEGGKITTITQAQLAGAVPVPGAPPLPLILANQIQGGDIMRQADLLKSMTG